MLTEDLTVIGHDFTWLRREVLGEELLEPLLPDEADAGAVLLLRRGKPELLSNFPHLGPLHESAYGEERAADVPEAHLIEEIGLVLREIRGAEHPDAGPHRVNGGVERADIILGELADIRAAHVVPGRDVVAPEILEGVLHEGLELDLAVAEHVGVRGAAGLVLREEVLEDVVPVLRGEVDGLKRDVKAPAD